MERQSLEQASSQIRCDRSEPACGVRRHHEGEVRHAGGTKAGPEPAGHEPRADPPAAHVEGRTVCPKPKRDDADAASRTARHTDQDSPGWAAAVTGAYAVRAGKGDGDLSHCG